MQRTEEEIEKLVNKIADYIIETKDSTRKTAEKFGVSNYTVSNYMNERLSEDDPRYEEIHQILDNHHQTIDKDITKNRILKELGLLLKGKNCNEIATILSISPSQVSHDLTDRLAKLIELSKENPDELKEFASMSKEILSEIRIKLRKNSIQNLEIGSNMTVQNQERDTKGRFK